jgi:hypothetical protein
MFKEEILFEIRQEARHFIDIEEENWLLYKENWPNTDTA